MFIVSSLLMRCSSGSDMSKFNSLVALFMNSTHWSPTVLPTAKEENAVESQRTSWQNYSKSMYCLP